MKAFAEAPKDYCKWIEDSDHRGTYDTDCGDAFEMMEGTPSDSDMVYCCYCGKRLVEIPFREAA